MSIYFYTITHEGTEYVFDSGAYGVEKVAAQLGIDPARIRRGGDIMSGAPLTHIILDQMRAADQQPLSEMDNRKQAKEAAESETTK